MCIFYSLGIGGTTMLVTSLSLTAEFIGSDTSSSAFIYGLMSFFDKLSTGFGVFFIQHLTPELKVQNGTFYGEVILYACGGAGILIIVGAISLFYVNVGVRQVSSKNILIPSHPDFKENTPLLVWGNAKGKTSHLFIYQVFFTNGFCSNENFYKWSYICSENMDL